MYRKILSLFLFSAALTRAASITEVSSTRGWVTDNTSIVSNGAQPLNNYFAGFEESVGAFRDWFAFSIPHFSGLSLVSATLNLDEPSFTQGPNFAPGHLGGPLTYSVYGLAVQPLAFNAVTTSNPFGSVATSNADNGSTVVINLNSAALAAIAMNQGQILYIGGIDSGETLTSGANGDFSGTQNEGTVSLILNLQSATVVPEPSPARLILLGACIPGLLLQKRRAT